MDHNHIKRQIFEHCHYGNHLTGDGNSNADDDGGPNYGENWRQFSDSKHFSKWQHGNATGV